MLDTRELEKEIKSQITKTIPNINFNGINFSIGTDNSPEGTYIYAQEDKYHLVFTEKGKVRVHRELDTKDEVLWSVLDIVVFDVAMDYAMKNRVQGEDFRRQLFAKEIELYARFGKVFENRKIDEINKILEENPYCDK